MIKSIGGINDEAGSIVPALLLARQDEDSLMKRFADEALLSIERKALLSALIDCLESDNDSIRLGATFYLFKVGKVDVKAVPALLKGLSHQDQRMKRGSESVLSSINEKELVPALIRALRSDDVLVRRGAAFYFWKATPRTDSKRIVKALNQAANDSDRILQIAVEKALERYR